MYFSAYASSKESGVHLITETAVAWCKALAASSEKLELIVMVPLLVYPIYSSN